MKLSKFSVLGLAATSFLLVNAVHITPPTLEKDATVSVSLEAPALARKAGGRARSGSFRSSSPSRSRPSTSRPSSGTRSTPSQRQPTYRSAPVYVPVPSGPNIYRSPSNRTTTPGTTGNQSSASVAAEQEANWFETLIGGLIGIIVLLILLGIPLAPIVLLVYLIIRVSRSGQSKTNQEVLNNIVTVSKIQVGLLAEARYIQEQLTHLTENLNFDSAQGTQQLAQETALALLRSPENWSHVLASSQTVKSREQAEQLFEQLSINERSKFSAETLVNVGGRVRRNVDLRPNEDDGPASYIVVTLLVGTAHDQPLFSQIRTETDLKQVLQSLAAMPPDYLLVFEVLWTPQDPNTSLSYEEMLTEYTEMVQI